MAPEDFLTAALSEQEREEKKELELRHEKRLQNGSAIKNTLPYKAFAALGVDPEEVVTTEGTSEVYTTGSFVIEGERMEVQFNCSSGSAMRPSVTFTILDVRSDINLTSGVEYFETNVTRVGRAIARALVNIRTIRDAERRRKVDVIKNYIPQRLEKDRNAARQRLHDLNQRVADDTVELEEDVKTALFAAIKDEFETVDNLYTQRAKAAAQVMQLARAYAQDLNRYEGEVFAWASNNTEKLWSPWSALKIEYTKVAANLAFPEFYNEYEEFPNLELTDEIVVLPEKANGWYQEINSYGEVKLIDVHGIVKTEPLKFSAPSTDRKLRFHQTYKCSTPGRTYYVNVPPLVEEEPTEVPVAPVNWRERVDIVDLSSMPDETIDSIYSAGGNRIIEVLRNALVYWL
jgi:hypothetical protein